MGSRKGFLPESADDADMDDCRGGAVTGCVASASNVREVNEASGLWGDSTNDSE